MRYLVLVLLLVFAVVLGIVLPHFFQDRLGGAGATTPAAKYEISPAVILWILRAIGLGVGLVAVLYFAMVKDES